jgi:hypothetical protein
MAKYPTGYGLDWVLAQTQELTDGELFAIIEDGVRFTGMPAQTQPSAGDYSCRIHPERSRPARWMRSILKIRARARTKFQSQAQS